MKIFGLTIISCLLILSCQKEKITLGTNVSETFYVDNSNASMRVTVEGNILSHIFLLLVHGGPGESSYFYKTDYITQNIGNKYAIVYWDQRNAGASQGSSNDNHLNLPQMTDDLKKVIQVIKFRYGQNSEVFLLGHSFGGLLTSSFMTSDNNQSLVKGWIFVDGSQNYPLNDTLTRQMLLNIGKQQVALNKNIPQWNAIISYCNAHTGNFTYAESNQLETFAGDAETYFDVVKQFDILSLIKENALKDDWPLTSILFNYLYSSNASFNNDLHTTQFSTLLYKVTTPTLLLFGQYDFICPQGLGVDLMNRISTTDKKMVISPISGHNLMYQDGVLFCQEVNDFIELHK
jgi:pimeloyl-ACP methyl ester carboxylesterase